MQISSFITLRRWLKYRSSSLLIEFLFLEVPHSSQRGSPHRIRALLFNSPLFFRFCCFAGTLLSWSGSDDISVRRVHSPAVCLVFLPSVMFSSLQFATGLFFGCQNHRWHLPLSCSQVVISLNIADVRAKESRRQNNSKQPVKHNHKAKTKT